MMKKIIRNLFLSVCIVTIFASISLHTNADINSVVLYGDVNEDYKVEVDDVTLIQRNLISMVDFSGLQTEAADYDHDGEVTVLDTTFMQRQLIDLPIPEGFGGWFDCYSTAKLAYADYASGKAMVGVPVTFTLQGGYPYYGYEPDDFYGPITYTIEIYDTSLSYDNGRFTPIVTLSGNENILTYTFDKAGNYDVCCTVCDRFDNETSYNCYYTVVEPYSTQKPVIASVYTDKPRQSESFNGTQFVPSFFWQEMTLYVDALGGSGEYEYSFELVAKDQTVAQDFSSDNRFSIEHQYFPGLDEYQAIQDENDSHWNDPDYTRKRYDWHDVTPYALNITVKDSDGNETTETVQILPVNDFDIIR